MAKNLHRLIRHAREGAEGFRILRGPSGTVNLWRFKSWGREDGGWRLVDQLKSTEDAEHEALVRLGLEPEKQMDRPTYVMARIEHHDDDFGWGYGFGGI